MIGKSINLLSGTGGIFMTFRWALINSFNKYKNCDFDFSADF
jgi:hypothetical protein